MAGDQFETTRIVAAVGAEGGSWSIPPADARRSPYPTRAAEPEAEYVSGGNSMHSPGWAGILQVLSWVFDEVDRQFGDDITRRMLTDPAIAACINHLALSINENELTISIPSAYRTAPGKEPDPAMEPLIEKARMYVDFARRCLDNLDVPIEETLQAMGDFPAWGVNLAELVYEPAPVSLGGPLGLLPRSVRPKTRDAWQFVVDDTWRVVGVYAQCGDALDWEVLPVDKFMWLTWLPRSGDPRGTRLIRPGFNSWHAKVRSGPELLRYLGRFGTPQVVGWPSPDDTESAETGNTTTGEYPVRAKGKGPIQRLFEVLVKWANSQVLVVRPGTEVKLIEAQGEGRAFLSSLEYWDRQMVLSIFGSVRAVLESRFGSRADSQTGQDVVALVKRAVRRAAATAVQNQLIYRAIELNFGTEEAREFCPTISLGGPEEHDLASQITAWVGAGYKLSRRHYPEIDAKVGLEPRSAQDMESDEEAAAKDSGESQTGSSGQSGNPGGDGQTDGGVEDETGSD